MRFLGKANTQWAAAFAVLLLNGAATFVHAEEITTVDCSSAIVNAFFRQEVVVFNFTSSDLDTQFLLYVCGQHREPPVTKLLAPFAYNGERSASYLSRKLADDKIDDLTVRDILLVFTEMERLRTYSLKDNEPLLKLLIRRVHEMKDQSMRETASKELNGKILKST